MQLSDIAAFCDAHPCARAAMNGANAQKFLQRHQDTFLVFHKVITFTDCGVNVAELLAAFLRRRGGSVDTAKLRAFFKTHPGARRIVGEYGGLLGFCAKHRSLLRIAACVRVALDEDTQALALDDDKQASRDFASSAPSIAKLTDCLHEQLAGLAAAGDVCIVRESGFAFASTASREVLRPLRIGEAFAAAGPPVWAGGELMLPVLLPGAVRLDRLEIIEELAPSKSSGRPSHADLAAATRSQAGAPGAVAAYAESSALPSPVLAGFPAASAATAASATLAGGGATVVAQQQAASPTKKYYDI